MGLTLGRYVLGSRIAAGGMGEVFHASQTGPDGFSRPCVVKTIQERFATEPELIELFLEEARLSARLNHSNIAQVYDFGKVGESYYMAMEFVDGPPLRSVIKWLQLRGGNVDVGVALRMVSQAAQALDYAHRIKGADGGPLNIVHRDISPANLLLSKQGLIKVIDFGIARARTTERVTQVGVVRGNVSYMAPEQVLGLPLDGRADVFGLGLVLYECLTLKRAQRVKSMLELARAQYVPIEPVSQLRPDCPEPVAQIVARALERKRELRFQTAGQMAQIIEDTLASLHLPVSPSQLAALAEEATAVQMASPSGFLSDSGASGRGSDRDEPPPSSSSSPRVSLGPPPAGQASPWVGPPPAPEAGHDTPRASPARPGGPRAAPPVPDQPPPLPSDLEELPASSGASSNELPTQLAHIPSLEELRSRPTPPPSKPVRPPAPPEEEPSQATVMGPVPSLDVLRAPAARAPARPRGSQLEAGVAPELGEGSDQLAAAEEPTNAGVRLEDVRGRARAPAAQGGGAGVPRAVAGTPNSSAASDGNASGPQRRTPESSAQGGGLPSAPRTAVGAPGSSAAPDGSTSGSQRRPRRASEPAASASAPRRPSGGSVAAPALPAAAVPPGAVPASAAAPAGGTAGGSREATVVGARPSRPEAAESVDPRATTLPVVPPPRPSPAVMPPGQATAEPTPVGPPPSQPTPSVPGRGPAASESMEQMRTLPELRRAAASDATALAAAAARPAGDTVPPMPPLEPSSTLLRGSVLSQARTGPGLERAPGSTFVDSSAGVTPGGTLVPVESRGRGTEPDAEPIFGSFSAEDKTPGTGLSRQLGTRTRQLWRRSFVAFAVAMMVSGLAFGWFLARCSEREPAAVAPAKAD